MTRKARKGAPAPEPVLGLRLPVPAASLGAALWLAYVAAHYAGMRLRFSPGDWADMLSTLARAPAFLGLRLPVVLLEAAGLWLAAAGWGGTLRRAAAGSAPRGVETACVDAALGLGMLSLVLLAQGLAGFFGPVWLRFLYGAWLSSGVALAARNWRADTAGPPAARGGLAAGAVWALIALAAATNLLSAFAPEIFYDALVYHLALPKLYLLRGAVVPTPENVYSGLPLGAQMLYGLALALSGEDLAALLHAAFGLAAALGLGACVRRMAGPRAGALAALLFYLCPLVVYASWACGVDLASAFYTTAALCALTGALGAASEAAVGRAALAGLLAGFAAGTKLNVLPTAGALVLGHAWLERRAGRGWRGSLAMAAALAAAVLPWLLKDLWFYGNPVYPFLYKHLGRLQPADWAAFLGAAGSRDLKAAFTTWAGFADLVTFPYRCTLGSWPLGDWAGPLLVPFLTLALCVRWREEGDGAPACWCFTAALAAAGAAAWWLASSLVRYVVPALPFLAAAVALALERGAWPQGLKRAFWAAALLGSALAFQTAWRQGAGFGQWGYLRGEISAWDYLTRQRVTYGLPPYAALKWMNEHLPPEAKVLFLGESRGFHLERDFTAATVYDENPFWAAAAAAKDERGLRLRLKDLGVTHLFVSARQLHYRHDAPPVLPRAVAGSDLVDRFFASWLDKLWEEREDQGEQARWLVVYQLRSFPGPAPGPGNPVRVVLDVLKRQGL